MWYQPISPILPLHFLLLDQFYHHSIEVPDHLIHLFTNPTTPTNHLIDFLMDQHIFLNILNHLDLARIHLDKTNKYHLATKFD